jgi:hypothetical protein
MKKLIYSIIIMPLLLSCTGTSSPKCNYSEKDKEQFLDDIVKNIEVSIDGWTEYTKALTTDKLLIVSRYPLPQNKLKEYNENKGTIINRDDDIADFATYKFKDYELINENNENLQFVDNGRAVYLRECTLWDYDNVLCQNVIIDTELNKQYAKLKGYIVMEFEMQKKFIGKIKKEVKISVNITLNDTVPE